MSERSDNILLSDILEAIEKIELYTLNITIDFFLNDFKTQDAVARNFSIIGEAASRLSPDFKTKYSMVNWREVKDFRNKLVHDYFGINPETVWMIIINELPALKKQLIDLQKSL